jgi:hypothetical protein
MTMDATLKSRDGAWVLTLEREFGGGRRCATSTPKRSVLTSPAEHLRRHRSAPERLRGTPLRHYFHPDP